MRPHGKFVRVDANDPRHTALCQRCGSPFNREDLSAQYRWAGPNQTDTGFRICWRCLDVPNPQERTLILPPDPPPVFDALQNRFPLDMITDWIILPPPGASMFRAFSAFYATPLKKAGGFKTVAASLAATSAMAAKVLTSPLARLAATSSIATTTSVRPLTNFLAVSGMASAPTQQAGLGFGLLAADPDEYAVPIAPPGVPGPLQIIFGDG